LPDGEAESLGSAVLEPSVTRSAEILLTFAVLAAIEILVDGDPRLFNPYEVILVNPAQHPHVNVAAATAFLDWLVSPEGREAIGDYRVNGEKVFEPSPGQTN